MPTIGQLGSRSDLEALRRSGRGKLVSLGLIIAIAAGGALWSFTREGGTGNPEDATRVLIVRRGHTAGYSIVLKDAGFEAAEGTFADWERRAEEEVPDLQAAGVAGIMELADRFGYGFVVFEDPTQLDFTALDVDLPELAPHHRFAVLSAGDFAFPHEITLNPEPSDVMRDPALLLLQALFEQDRLADARDISGSSLESLKLHDRLSSAIDKLERVPKGEKMAFGIEQQVESMLVEQERAEPRPDLIGDALESLVPVALNNGSILTVSRSLAIVSADGVRPNLELAGKENFLVVRPQESERTECPTLAGGSLSEAESPRFTMAADGSSLLIRTLSDGLALWRLRAPQVAQPGQPAPIDDGCQFERAGSIAPAQKGIEAMGVPHAGKAVARAGRHGGMGMVTIVRPDVEGRRELGMIEGAKLQRPVWLDDTHLVAVGTHPERGDGLYFVATDAPDRVLVLSAAVFDGAAVLGEVAAVPAVPADGTPTRASFVVTAGEEPQLHAVTLPASLSGLFATPPSAPGQDPVERAGLPTIFTLDPAQFTMRALTHQGAIHEPSVSPDGRLVAFSILDADLDRPDASADEEIGLVSLDGSFPGMKLLTRNALPDLRPQFAANGTSVVFETRVQIPQTSWIITAARRVGTPPPPAPAPGGDAGTVGGPPPELTGDKTDGATPETENRPAG